ncbi:vasorin-like [Strongylocentrotus purpuratus]|nr:vasorin-like [Strongylocentrotus purpuratus]
MTALPLNIYLYTEILRCPANCSCGESQQYVGIGPPLTAPRCGDPDWLPFWVKCTDGWNEDYANATAPKAIIINLDGAPVRHLMKGAFSGLNNAHTLDLSSTQLSHLPAGVFIGLCRLWELALDHNSLTVLENGTFEGLRNLGGLNLAFNQITRLYEGCFRGLQSLFIM